MTRKFRAISYTLAFTAMLVLALSMATIAAAETITVDNKIGSAADYTSIQAAVNGAHKGDTILVYPGTYVENVDVNVENISIRSFSGNPEDTVVNANNSGNNVFDITADFVEISGFTVSGVTGYDCFCSGIYLHNVSGVNISNNILLDNYYGLYLNKSNWNVLISNYAIENYHGIYLANLSNCNTLNGNNVTDNKYGILLDESCRNTLIGNNAEAGNWGICLNSSSNYNTLADNTASENNFFGIDLRRSNSNTLVSNCATGNHYLGIGLMASDNNTLTSNLMWGSTYNFYIDEDSLKNSKVDTSNFVDGKAIYYFANTPDVTLDSSSNAGTVYLINCTNATVKDLLLENNRYGIYLYNTTYSILENNTALNNYFGTYLCSSSNNTLKGNNALNNHYGIFLDGSGSNTLNGNNATGSSRGIHLYASGNNTLIENMVNLNYYGIDLSNSSSSTLVSNFMWDNNYNFHAGVNSPINGFSYGDYLATNNVSSSNLVDGKSIYYLVNVSDVELDSSSNAGIIYLINCKNILVKDLLLEDKGNCLCLYNTTNSTLVNNTISNNYRGIFLWDSSRNSLVGNRVKSNRYFGIFLKNSQNNAIYNNYFCNMNNVSLEGTNVGNVWNTTKTAKVNIVEGSFLGGNFWGTPVESGFSQKNLEDADGDGICDVSYSIDENNIDYLPLQSFLIQYLTYNAVGEPTISPSIWNCTNCDFFFHEIANGVKTSEAGNSLSTENLTVSIIENREISENELIYRTEIKPVKYRYQEESWNGQTYPVLGFFGNLFVPLRSVGDETWESRPDKLARLLVDSSDMYSLKTGELLYLGEGYAIEAMQVDVEGDKVWLRLTKDGGFIDDKIVSVVEGEAGDWIVDLDDVEDEDDVIVMRVHVNRILEDDVRHIIQIQGIWLIDFDNAFTIEQNEEFGNLEVTSIGDDYLELKNKQLIILERNSVQEIGEGFNFKVLDSPELIYYPFKEVTINLDEEPLINNFYPLASEISTSEGKLQEFSLNTSVNSNLTLSINGKEVQSENSTTFLSYQNSTASKGVYYIQATARTEDEEARHSWIWIVDEKDEDDEGSNSNSNKKSGGSSSSGGGGGGGSPEPASNIETKELAQAFVTNGNHVKFEFKENATCVGCVEFDAKRTFGKTTTIVEMLKGNSKIVPELPPGDVYKNVNIWVGNEGMGTPENIENALIGFKVEKAWVLENSIDLLTVTLYRYNDSVWNALPTVMAGEDEEYFYFTAEAPGFSPFAIAGESKAVSISPEGGLESEDMEKGLMDSEVSAPTGKEEKKTPGFGTTFAIGGLLSVLYLLKRK